jgi:hypothetical protein
MASPSLPAAQRPGWARRGLLLLAVLALLAPGACSSPLSMSAKEPDPGIAADLTVIQSRTGALFTELDRNAAMAFADYDAIHYRPLLDMVGEAQHLAKIHERPGNERRMLDDLEATYQDMRKTHREGKLSFENLRAYRQKLDGQIEALLRLEQR